MLDWVLDAVAGARRTVVVGPEELSREGVITVLEDPPLGGPAAGVAAGIEALDPTSDLPVVVLACDVPLAADAVPGLLAALADAEGADGVQLLDDDGRRQPLLAVYRRAALTGAVERLRADGGAHGASMRRLLGGLATAGVEDTSGAARDGDTWEAVAGLDDVITRRRA
jgi:molybdopterin-guanine dinucleotide biosynthesis protein A